MRADFFNVLDRPNFGPGTGDMPDPTFNDPTYNEGGIFIGNVTGGRIGRIQARFVFRELERMLRRTRARSRRYVRLAMT